MNVRNLILSLLILPFVIAASAAQARRITTHKAPSYLFADSAAGQIHALTAGVDINFDGQYQADSGDVLPRWYVIDAATEKVVDSAAFEGFFSSFPIRAGVDLKGRRLYFAQLGRVRAYDIDTRSLAQDSIVTGFFSGVSFDPVANTIAVTERPGFTDPGWVMINNPTTGDTLARVGTGINPSMTASIPAAIAGSAEYYTLCEGVSGAPNSKIGYTMIAQDVYRTVNARTLGGGGTYMVTKGDLACIALGGGHKVHVIDTKTHRDLPYSPYSLGPAGQNGPRTLAFQGDSILLIGTYSSELMRMRLSDGVIVDTMKMRGKVETILVHDSLAYVAIRNPRDGGVDSAVMVVNLKAGRVIDSLMAGPEPIAVVRGANGDINVLSVGAGDSAHVWRVFDAVTHAPKSAGVFKGSLFNPFRYVHDEATDTLYMVISGVLRAFPVAGAGEGSRAVYTPAGAYGRLIAVSDAGDYLLGIESTVTGAGNEYLHVIDKSGTLLAKFKTSARPIMAARVTPSHAGAIALYMLDRGITSAQASNLDLYEFQPNILGADTLGKGANHITLVGRIAGVTMNASHSFLTVDLDTWSVEKRVATGTEGFDGPREAVILDNDRVAVTTYAGDVRVLRPTGEMKAYPIGGKGEGITALGGKVFAASAFTPTYAADSAVVVFDNSALVATVERREAVASAVSLDQNYPNPATSSTSVRFTLDRPAHVTLAVYSANGELIRNTIDRAMESGEYVATLDLSGLASGSYLYTLVCNGRTLTRTMKVVR